MRWTCGIAAAALLSCGAPGSTQLVPADATVELDAFSGRPNPRWRISVEEARDLSQRISDLDPARGAALPDVGLGYRGFYIDSVGGERVFITHGLIAFMTGDRARVIYRDARGAEEALQAQARARGFGDVFRRQ